MQLTPENIKQSIEASRLQANSSKQNGTKSGQKDEILFLFFNAIEKLEEQIVKPLLEDEIGFRERMYAQVVNIVNECFEPAMLRLEDTTQKFLLYWLQIFVSLFLDRACEQTKKKMQRHVEICVREVQTKLEHSLTAYNILQKRLEDQQAAQERQERDFLQAELRLKEEIFALGTELQQTQSQLDNLSSLEQAESPMRGISSNLQDLQKEVQIFQRQHSDMGISLSSHLASMGGAIVAYHQDAKTAIDRVRKQFQLFACEDSNAVCLFAEHPFTALLTLNQLNKQEYIQNDPQVSLQTLCDFLCAEAGAQGTRQSDVQSLAHSFVERLLTQANGVTYTVAQNLYSCMAYLRKRLAADKNDVLVQLFGRIFGVLGHEMLSRESVPKLLALTQELLLFQQQLRKKAIAAEEAGEREKPIAIMQELEEDARVEEAIKRLGEPNFCEQVRLKVKIAKFQNAEKKATIAAILVAYLVESQKSEEENLKNAITKIFEKPNEERYTLRSFEELEQLIGVSVPEEGGRAMGMYRYYLQRYWNFVRVASNSKSTKQYKDIDPATVQLLKRAADGGQEEGLILPDECLRMILTDIVKNTDRLQRLGAFQTLPLPKVNISKSEITIAPEVLQVSFHRPYDSDGRKSLKIQKQTLKNFNKNYLNSPSSQKVSMPEIQSQFSSALANKSSMPEFRVLSSGGAKRGSGVSISSQLNEEF